MTMDVPLVSRFFRGLIVDFCHHYIGKNYNDTKDNTLLLVWR